MKTLNCYKARYRAAKTNETRAKIMNGAMMNLSHSEQQKFIEWQVEFMRYD